MNMRIGALPRHVSNKDGSTKAVKIAEEIEIKENEEELETELDVEDAETDQDEMMEFEEEEFSEPFISVEQMPMLGDCEDEACTQTEIMKFKINI